MAEFAASAAANTVGNLATEYTSPYLSYFFRYGKIAEDFKNQRNELRLKEDRVKNEVDVAERQAEIIDKDVENWLERVEKELRETQILEDEMDRIKCSKWCPNWGWRYSLSKNLAKKTLIISKLVETCNFPSVGRRAPLQGIEFITSKDFRDSESSKSALKEIMEAKQIQLRSLSEKEGWGLFKANAGLKDDYFSLIDVAKEVADECKGLPLAIVTVAKALRGESLDGWRAANQRLKDSRHLDNEQVFGEVYKLLKLSYDYLNKNNSQTRENDIQSCFLLCSLFPEDFEIPMEMLIMCGIGAGLFSNAYSIEDKRREILVALTNLQSSGLLLETDDGGRTVRMHDVVRDFAHWLTSMGENRFMVKDKLKEWPNVVESLGSYTAMALRDCGCLNHFPKTVEFPKLKTLFLNGEGSGLVLSTDFEEMKGLQVLFVSDIDFSLEGLQSLTNLRTLCLGNCKLKNISSSLRNMRRLEILALFDTDIDEITEELAELSTLKSLYIRYDEDEEKRIISFPPNLLSRLTSLQELHVMNKNNVNLVELNSLSRLTALSLSLSTDQCCQENLVFPKLQRYNIVVNGNLSSERPTFRTILKIKNLSSSLSAFKNLFCNVEKLSMENVRGKKNISFNMPFLRELRMEDCPKLGCFIVQSQQIEKLYLDNAVNNCQLCSTDVENHEEVFRVQDRYFFSSMKKLHLLDLSEVRIIWKDPAVFLTLENLTSLYLYGCKKLSYIFTPSTARNLSQLANLNIWGCEELEGIILDKDQASSSSNADIVLQTISFPNLTEIKVIGCNNLKSLFPLGSATSLQKLVRLIVRENMKLEQVFEVEDEAQVTTKKEIQFDKLECLSLNQLPCLIDFCPKGYHFLFPGLRILVGTKCPKMTTTFSIDSKQIVHSKTEATEGSVSEPTPDIVHDKDIHWKRGRHVTLPHYIE
ncbi:hypothetical protein V6N13_037651 [Hibiscus sabdariffa]